MNSTEYVRATLERFVRIPSSEDTGVDAILDAAAKEIEGLGLSPVVHADVKAVEASSGLGGVLFNGHLDTVPIASGWTRPPGTWDGDDLYGRGASDMKAGCVAALAAGRDLRPAGVPFSLLFTTDEETTMAGAKKLASAPVVTTASAVVVGEPTGLRVIHQEKGVLWYRATVRGRSAHGSLPQMGDNAIHRMARVVSRLESLSRPRDVLEDFTVNIGQVQGGVAPNVVADACTVDLDCRHPPSLTKEDVEARLRHVFRDAGEEASLEIRHEVPAAGVPADAPHIRLLRDLAGSEIVGVTYATEMAYYAQHNRRCAVFGPGDPQRIHVPDERVSLKETVRASACLAEFGRRMVRPS